MFWLERAKSVYYKTQPCAQLRQLWHYFATVNNFTNGVDINRGDMMFWDKEVKTLQQNFDRAEDTASKTSYFLGGWEDFLTTQIGVNFCIPWYDLLSDHILRGFHTPPYLFSIRR